jgi:flagellar protein FlgJ
MLITPNHTASTPPDQAALSTTAKHVMGMLWDEMLQVMNQNGLDTTALGTGSDAFQGMFLWDIAQNDFGKYDTALTEATIRQMGGAATPAARVIAPPPPLDPLAMLGALGNAASLYAAAIPAAVQQTPLPPLNNPAPAAGTPLAQAQNFAQAIWPQVTAAAQQLGVPAVAILAQTALETGWGSAAPGNNLFGIKAAPGHAGTVRATFEMVDGVLQPQTASFRDYPSAAASVADYVDTVKSAFSSAVDQSSINGFAAAMQSAGYATDTHYAKKLINLSQSPLMQQVLQGLTGKLNPAQSELTPMTGRVSP